MDHQYGNEELRDVLGVLENLTASGAPRLLPPARQRIIRATIGRNADLHGLARQAIRLAVALQVISGKPHGKEWLLTLHGPLALLRTERFKAAFEQHPSPNVLSTADRNIYLLTGPGLDANDGSPFSLDLKRAPSLGGYLDLVCWMLGFEEVERFVTRAVAEGSAEEAAKELHCAVLAWLDERLPRDHLERQRAVIRTFLELRRAESYLDVNDEAILSFWEETALGPKDLDGFRSWQSAVRLIIAYRAALREAGDAQAIYGDGQEMTENEDAASPLDGSWVSPLAELAESEGARPAVKWFSSKDGRALVGTFLTERRTRDEKDDELPGNAFADRRPDETLALTWLRYVAFGPRQRSRASSGNADAVSFTETLGKLDTLSEDLKVANSAAIWALINAAPEVGLTRLARINAQTVIEAFAEAEDVDRDRVREALKAFSEVANDDPDSFRTMLTELALYGGTSPEAMRERFRLVKQADVVEESAATDITIRLAEIVQRDRQAAKVILKAQAVFAAADMRHGLFDPDDVAKKAAAILISSPAKAMPINDCRSAYAKINSAGFRKEDRGSDEVVEAMRLGTIHLPDVLTEVSRIRRACQAKEVQAAFDKDVARFEAVFDQLYARG